MRRRLSQVQHNVHIVLLTLKIMIGPLKNDSERFDCYAITKLRTSRHSFTTTIKTFLNSSFTPAPTAAVALKIDQCAIYRSQFNENVPKRLIISSSKMPV